MFVQGFDIMTMAKPAAGTDFPVGKKFAGAGSGSDTSFNAVMRSLMSHDTEIAASGVLNLKSMLNCEDVLCKNGNDLIELLGKYLDFKGMSPDMLSMDEEGLGSLGKLLKGLGFSNERVDTLLKTLKGSGNGNSVSMKKVLSELGAFLKDNDNSSEIDISSLPYLESILAGLNVNQEKIREIMAEATGEKGTIDLDALLNSLKNLTPGSDYPENALGRSTGISANSNLLAGLGLQSGAEGKLTLDEFISKLEALATKGSGRAVTDSTAASLAKTVSDSIRMSDKAGTEAGRGNWNFGQGAGFNAADSLDKAALNQLHKTENSLGNHLNNTKMNRFQDAGMAKETMDSFDRTLKELSGRAKQPDDISSLLGRSIAGQGVPDRVTGFRHLVYSEKTLPSYVTGQVERQLVQAVKNGDSLVRFQIKPPDLGRIQLSIETTNAGMKVTILAEQSATRDMLMSNTGELKTLLADQGIRLDKLDVDVSGQFGQSLADARHGAGNAGKDKRNRNDKEFALDGLQDGIMEDTESDQVRYRRGSLDLVA